MLALGAKLFELPEHLEKGRRITDGCIWAYRNTPTGVMPEVFFMTPCESESHCPWDEQRWKQEVLKRAEADPGNLTLADAIIAQKQLPGGFSSIRDSRYILRPEAIESVFVLYRTTGDRRLLEEAWLMFQSVQKYTQTELANAALADVTDEKSAQLDTMESFWLGETLKYFYLMFCEPDVVSLDEYVFNTEAHPFKRLVP
jgi:mannosyl-oligosaccharide alpha-1,2-mannosidase